MTARVKTRPGLGLLALAFLLPAPASAQARRQDQVSHPRGQFSDFNRVIADTAVNVEIRIDPAASFEIDSDDNLAGRFAARVENGVLRLRRSGKFSTPAPLIRVTTPRLEGVQISSGSYARLIGLNGGRLSLVSYGSGRFAAEGTVEELDLLLDGSSNADLSALRAGRARVVLRGTGVARIHATDELAATVYGPGRIVYRGNPHSVKQAVNGPGRISRDAN